MIPFLPALKPAFSIASTNKSKATSTGVLALNSAKLCFLYAQAKFGANPPSSPTAVISPFDFNNDFKAWKVSLAHCIAWLKVLAPTGIIMNSWKSTAESACAPPLITFNIGTGSS